MPSSYTQDKRIGKLETPLGKDKLVLLAFDGNEGMSENFEFHVEALSEDNTILVFDDSIGKHCTITLNTIGGGERIIDGMLAEASWTGTRREGHTYELTLRPWLWMLSKRVNSLIFHEKTAPQIIEQVFQEHGGLADFRPALSRNYPTLEYVAQYRESDMDFVCRLMEEHGISYHFRHSKGAHQLIMGDGNSAYIPVPRSSRPFIAVDARHRRDTEHISLWRPERKFTTGKVAMTDYDFKKPSANMKADKSGDAAYAHGTLESYIYPGRYVDPSAGNDYAQVHVDRHRAEDQRYYAEGDCVSFFPGGLVDLTGHPDSNQNKQFLVLKSRHSFTGESYRSGSGDAASYTGRYVLMRSDKQYAPPANSPKPYIRGPQTAEVVGDGEIDCDKYGRILVRFHWDRKTDQSRRVRVGQVAAGKSWGAIFTPRVGMEVIVDYLEGDPDQPIITGCVYNGENMPPFDLPGSKNISGWKTNSTTGGGGYNEFVMDDTKGNELVRMHAQYDLDSTVENDERRLIKQDRNTTIKNNDTLDVTNEILIKAGQKITIVCGKSKITMDPMSIKIESPTVEILTDLQFKTESKLMSDHKATAVMTINGAMVKIN
jgi:type VI secretion system secreted protein VgrG